MKKIAIILAGLLLMVSSGCSDEDRKETAEKTKEAVTATKERPRNDQGSGIRRQGSSW